MQMQQAGRVLQASISAALPLAYKSSIKLYKDTLGCPIINRVVDVVEFAKDTKKQVCPGRER